MTNENPILIARGLIERHGMRATALAEARAQEARLSGDAAAMRHWDAVALATAELRRTGRLRAQPTRH